MPTITLHNENKMIEFGTYCATQLNKHRTFYLLGDLGAGKTTWMKGILAGLGSDETLRSPTYPILQRYQVGGKELLHFDLYRLDGDDDFIDSGLCDELEVADFIFIEWPTRVTHSLPKPDIELNFQITDDAHSVTMSESNANDLALSAWPSFVDRGSEK